MCDDVDRPRLGVVVGCDAARHIEKLRDPDVGPRGILGQPLPDGVADAELSFCFKTKQAHRREGFGVAADLKDAARCDRGALADLRRTGGRIDRRRLPVQKDAQRSTRDMLRLGVRLEVGLQLPLQFGCDWDWLRRNRRGRCGKRRAKKRAGKQRRGPSIRKQSHDHKL